MNTILVIAESCSEFLHWAKSAIPQAAIIKQTPGEIHTKHGVYRYIPHVHAAIGHSNISYMVIGNAHRRDDFREIIGKLTHCRRIQ